MKNFKNISISNEKKYWGFSSSPRQKNSPHFITGFNKIDILSEETDISTEKMSTGINKEKN